MGDSFSVKPLPQAGSVESLQKSTFGKKRAMPLSDGHFHRKAVSGNGTALSVAHTRRHVARAMHGALYPVPESAGVVRNF